MPANPLGVLLRSRRAGQHTLVWARPGLQAPENFTLASPAFDHGTPIPDKHRGRLRGANISPALSWTPPPAPPSSRSSCRTPTSRLGSRPPTRSRWASIPRSPASPRTASPTRARSRGSGTARARSGAAAGPGPCRCGRTGRTPTSSSSSPSARSQAAGQLYPRRRARRHRGPRHRPRPAGRDLRDSLALRRDRQRSRRQDPEIPFSQ